ncbi:MAG TPA: hypothetical protein VJA87_01420 [Candidatus Paceibacterota bacterium]
MNKKITDIIPPSRRRAMELEDAASNPTPDYVPPLAPLPPPPPRPLSDRPMPMPGGRRRFPYGTALIVLLIVLLSVGAMYWFSGAEVKVAPESNSAFVTGDFTATAGGGDLPFEIITVEKTAGTPVPAESTEMANDPASGRIVISNAQASPQTLIKNTRFESPNGLIYRIQDSITIPAGSVANPGTLEVTVYADAGGDSYNIGPAAFTVPGLKGSASFDLVTAKSSGPMTGGFSGERASVGTATREAQDTKNRAALETSLREGMQEALPDGYILVPGASFVSYTPTPDTTGRDSTVTVTTKGTMTAVVFPQSALAKSIAYKVVGSYAGQPISIPSAEGLTLTSSIEGAPVGLETFTFALNGNTTLVWDIDPTRIAGAVAGKSRDAAKSILQSFPEVSSATLVLRPFWASTFPDDPANIKVTTEAVGE